MKVILASGSPRREMLLAEVLDDFEVIPAKLEEPQPQWDCSLAPAIWAESLAYLKAGEVVQSHPDALVIAADTICAHSGRIIGKPRDIDDARDILTNHFAGIGQVITGLAVLCPEENIKIIDHVITELNMRPMSDSELEDYLASGIWQGKAGAYAYQEGGDKYVKAIKGSVSNIVGLPMERLTEMFAQFNILDWLK